MTTHEKVQRIQKAFEAGQGSIKELCAKEGMATSYFYNTRKHGPAKKAKAKYGKPQTSFVDVPMQEEIQGRVVIVTCGKADLKEVLEHLK